MLRRLLTTLILTLTLAPGVTLAADPLAVRYYEDAVNRFNSGDLEGAVIQLKNALQRDPSQLSARILMGRVQLDLGNNQQAEEELVHANQLGADPVLTTLPLAKARNRIGKHKVNIENLIPTRFPRQQQPDIWVELGIARLQDGDTAGAAIAFEQALDIEPEHVGGALGKARIPLNQQKYAAAEQLAESLVTRFPDNADAWFLYASALHAQGENAEAAESYARSRDLDPGKSAAGLGEATALLDANQVARASAVLQELRESFPWMHEALYLHSKALARLGHSKEADAAFKAAVERLDPIAPADLAHSPALLRLAGTIAYENGQMERAHQAIALYLQARPSDIEVRKMMARIAMQMDKPGDAKRALVPITSAGQADAETLAMLGDANAQLHDYAVAESYYRDAIANYRGGPLVIGRIGAMQYRKGQRTQALNTLQGILDDLRTTAPSGVSLYTAMLYLAEGRIDQAENIVAKLLDKEPENPIALNLRAALAIARGKLPEAHAQLSSLIDKHPDFRPARYNLAKLHTMEGQYDAAEDELTRFLTEDENDTRALLESARLALKRNDVRLAIQFYERVLELNDKALAPAIELTNLYLAQSRPADAMNVALTLRQALPNHAVAHQNLARVQIARNEPEDAQGTLQKAVALARYDPRRLMGTARLQKAAGAYADAADTLNKVVAEVPDSLVARNELAETLFLDGNLDGARSELKLVVESDPDNVLALALQGDIYMAEGRFPEAASNFTKALNVSERPELVVSLFRAETLAGNGEAALDNLKAWNQANPDNALVIRALAESLQQAGRANAARPYYEKLLKLLPNDPLVHNNYANLLVDVDNERAFKSAQRAHELAPSNAAILDTLGWSLVQIGDLEKGLAHLRDAVARDGRSASARYHLGVALHEYGSSREARRQLKKALELAKDAEWREDAENRLDRISW